jgi:hypothetical protein
MFSKGENAQKKTLEQPVPAHIRSNPCPQAKLLTSCWLRTSLPRLNGTAGQSTAALHALRHITGRNWVTNLELSAKAGCINPAVKSTASQLAEKLEALKGHSFAYFAANEVEGSAVVFQRTSDSPHRCFQVRAGIRTRKETRDRCIGRGSARKPIEPGDIVVRCPERNKRLKRSSETDLCVFDSGAVRGLPSLSLERIADAANQPAPQGV